MTSYLSGSRIFFLELVVHYCSSKDFVNKRYAPGETTVYQMEAASEFVLFTALRKVDLYATQSLTRVTVSAVAVRFLLLITPSAGRSQTS